MPDMSHMLPCPVGQLMTHAMNDVQTCMLACPNTAILPVKYNNCRAGGAAYLGMSEAPEQQDGGFWQLLVHLGCVLIPSHLVLL